MPAFPVRQGLPGPRRLFLQPVAVDGLLDELRGRHGAGHHRRVCRGPGWRETEETEWVEAARGVVGGHGNSAMCSYGYRCEFFCPCSVGIVGMLMSGVGLLI